MGLHVSRATRPATIYRGTLRGPDYMQMLRRRLHKLGVRILDHSPAVALLRTSEGVAGAWGVSRTTSERWTVRAGAVVIATGGCAFRSKALGTYGLTGDGLIMAAELGAELSGMEFAGQYGISHAAATVTKNLIYDWATFSDEAGTVLEGGDNFEILARHLPHGPVYAVIDKASPTVQEGLRRGQPNIFLALDRQGIDPFRQRFPVTLRYEGTVRGVGGLRDRHLGRDQRAWAFCGGDAASRETVVGAVSGGGGPNATWAIVSGLAAGRAAAEVCAPCRLSRASDGGRELRASSAARRRDASARRPSIQARGLSARPQLRQRRRASVSTLRRNLADLWRSLRDDEPGASSDRARPAVAGVIAMAPRRAGSSPPPPNAPRRAASIAAAISRRQARCRPAPSCFAASTRFEIRRVGTPR